MIYWEDKIMGKVFGRLYRFEHEGDSLPSHAHGPDEEHNIIVLHGGVSVLLDWRILYGVTGDLIEFDSSKEHRVYATFPGSRTLHLYLNGRPNWYDGLPTRGTYPDSPASDIASAEGRLSSTGPYVGNIR